MVGIYLVVFSIYFCLCVQGSFLEVLEVLGTICRNRDHTGIGCEQDMCVIFQVGSLEPVALGLRLYVVCELWMV